MLAVPNSNRRRRPASSNRNPKASAPPVKPDIFCTLYSRPLRNDRDAVRRDREAAHPILVGADPDPVAAFERHVLVEDRALQMDVGDKCRAVKQDAAIKSPP